MPKQHFNPGLIQVYTGDGKGKTTAALGLALRALGNGFTVFMGQFMKGQEYGELRSVRRFRRRFVIEQFGTPNFVAKNKTSETDRRLATAGLQRLEQVVSSGETDLVIMDEINVALDFKLIPLVEVLRLLKQKPAHVEIVCTGRHAPAELLQCADLVTEMKEIKHYYHRGVPARVGIEK